MATGFRKILEGLRLIPKAASTASEKGDLDVVASSGKLNYHNGTTASPVVTEDHSATLSNKTLDAAVIDNDLDLNNFALLNTGSIESSQQINIVTPNTYPSGLLITDDPTYTTTTYALHIVGRPSGVVDIYSGYNSIDFHSNTTKFWDDGDGVSKVEIESPEGAIYLSKVFPITPTTLLTISSPEQTISGNDTGPLLIATGNGAIDANSGIIEIQTGNAESSSGFVSIQTGAANINSGAMTLQTGGSVNGSTGDINITTGYSSLGPSSRGDINLDSKDLTATINGTTLFVTDDVIFTTTNNRIKIGDPAGSDAVSIKFDFNAFPNQVEFRNELNALLPLQIASPTLSDQAATKSYVDAVNIVSSTAGENITAGDVVYISTGTGSDSGRTAGRVYKLNAKNDDRVEFFGFANTTALSGAAVLVQVSGKRSGLSGLSVGKPVFASVAVSGNEGAVQTTAPTAANQWVIPVGVAISATELVVNGAGSATAVKITSEVVDNLYADVITPSSNTILTNANSVVLATGGAGGITITLPSPAVGKIFNIKKIDAGVGAITIQTPSGQTIDAFTTVVIGSQYESLTITSDGTNFFII